MRRITEDVKLEDLQIGEYVIVTYRNGNCDYCFGIVTRHHCNAHQNEFYILSYNDPLLDGAFFMFNQRFKSRYIATIDGGTRERSITNLLVSLHRVYVAVATIYRGDNIPDSCVGILEEISPLFETGDENQGDYSSDSSSDDSSEGYPLDSYFVSNYSRDTIYRGIYHYHYHHGIDYNTPKRGTSPYRIGVELEVEFTDYDTKSAFCDAPSNWLYRESDGSLSSMGVEIITIPMLPKDIKSVSHWQVLTDSISRYARSWDTSSCGLHVHIGREILGSNEEKQSETIGKLLYFYHQYLKDSAINRKIYGRDRGYNDHDCKTPEGDAVKVLGADVLKQKSVQDKVKKSVIDKARETRYFDINLQNSHTIEFRKGRGSLNPERIVAVIEWSELIIQYAKSTPWVNISLEDFLNYLRIIKPKSSKINAILEDYC